MTNDNELADRNTISVKTPSLRRAIFLALLLVVIDAFLFNQGVIAPVVGVWMLVVALQRTFLEKKFATVRGERLRDIAVNCVAVILVFGINAANNRLARHRAETLISAIDAFHVKNGRYPTSLEELVPDFLERVPVANYTFMFNQYWHHSSDRETVLFYVATPPFGRPTYSFTRNSWGYVD